MKLRLCLMPEQPLAVNKMKELLIKMKGGTGGSL